MKPVFISEFLNIYFFQLLEKDEKIQRIFLLSQSTHILKYSIDKVSNILETIHTKLTQENDLYELANLTEAENSAYIFHILEILIKRYSKSKNLVENSQNSQETEKILKRSSISDIWRKKWNPNYKEDFKIAGNCEKKCVIVKCREILNKLVVECMNGYGLVAFAALQCFNLLQD